MIPSAFPVLRVLYMADCSSVGVKHFCIGVNKALCRSLEYAPEPGVLGAGRGMLQGLQAREGGNHGVFMSRDHYLYLHVETKTCYL